MNYENEIDSLIQGVSLAIGKPIPRRKYEILDRGLPHLQPTRLPFEKWQYICFCLIAIF